MGLDDTLRVCRSGSLNCGMVRRSPPLINVHSVVSYRDSRIGCPLIFFTCQQVLPVLYFVQKVTQMCHFVKLLLLQSIKTRNEVKRLFLSLTFFTKQTIVPYFFHRRYQKRLSVVMRNWFGATSRKRCRCSTSLNPPTHEASPTPPEGFHTQKNERKKLQFVF